MRIRNKMLLAMSIPIGLLVLQVVAVNYFVRELQSAVRFIAAAHTAIEADFAAMEVVAELRRRVKQLPSGAVMEQTTREAADFAQASWQKLNDAIATISAANATQRVDWVVLEQVQNLRKMMLERQREGIARAKAEGRYKGRKPTARAKADEIKALSAEGVSLSEIARRLEIGKASVHRVLSATA